jgi:hypothetical protein
VQGQVQVAGLDYCTLEPAIRPTDRPPDRNLPPALPSRGRGLPRRYTLHSAHFAWHFALSSQLTPSDSVSHLKTSLVGNSITLPIAKGRLVLGTWQGIYLAEFVSVMVGGAMQTSGAEKEENENEKNG